MTPFETPPGSAKGQGLPAERQQLIEHLALLVVRRFRLQITQRRPLDADVLQPDVGVEGRKVSGRNSGSSVCP